MVRREFRRKSTSPFQRNLVQSDHEKSVSPEKEVSVPTRESKRSSTSPFHRKTKENLEEPMDVTPSKCQKDKSPEEFQTRESKRSSTSPFCRKNKEVSGQVEISPPLKKTKNEESKEVPVRESKRNSTSPFHRKNKANSNDTDEIFTVPEVIKKKIIKKGRTQKKVAGVENETKSVTKKMKSSVNIKLSKNKSTVPKKDPVNGKEAEKKIVDKSEKAARNQSAGKEEAKVDLKKEENISQDTRDFNTTKKCHIESKTENIVSQNKSDAVRINESVSVGKEKTKIAEIKFHGKEVKEISKLPETKEPPIEVSKIPIPKPEAASRKIDKLDDNDTKSTINENKVQEGKTDITENEEKCSPETLPAESIDLKLNKSCVSPTGKLFPETYSRKKTAVKVASDNEGTVISLGLKSDEKNSEMEVVKPREKTPSPEKEPKRKQVMTSPIHPKKAKLLAHQARQEEEMKLKNKSEGDQSESVQVNKYLTGTGGVVSPCQTPEKVSATYTQSLTFSDSSVCKSLERPRFGKGSKLEKIARQLSTGTLGLHCSEKPPLVSDKSLAKESVSKPAYNIRKPESPTVALDLSKSATVEKPVSMVDKFRDRYTPQYEDISDPESLENNTEKNSS